MDPNDTITEIGNAGAIDLTAAREKIKNAKAEIAAAELLIAQSELIEAEKIHAGLVLQCRAAQDTFDDLDRRVEAQKHIVYQANTERAAGPMRTQVFRGNALPKYATAAERAEWEAGLAVCLQAEQDANAAAAAAFAELSRLQGERRQAVSALDKVTWEELPAKQRVGDLRKKLTAMKPRNAAPPAWEAAPPESMVLQLDRDGAHQVR